MEHKIIVEIDGVRHKLIEGDKVISGCTICSLEDYCFTNCDGYGLCSPHKSTAYGHFELEK